MGFSTLSYHWLSPSLSHVGILMSLYHHEVHFTLLYISSSLSFSSPHDSFHHLISSPHPSFHHLISSYPLFFAALDIFYSSFTPNHIIHFLSSHFTAPSSFLLLYSALFSSLLVSALHVSPSFLLTSHPSSLHSLSPRPLFSPLSLLLNQRLTYSTLLYLISSNLFSSLYHLFSSPPTLLSLIPWQH